MSHSTLTLNTPQPAESTRLESPAMPDDSRTMRARAMRRQPHHQPCPQSPTKMTVRPYRVVRTGTNILATVLFSTKIINRRHHCPRLLKCTCATYNSPNEFDCCTSGHWQYHIILRQLTHHRCNLERVTHLRIIWQEYLSWGSTNANGSSTNPWDSNSHKYDRRTTRCRKDHRRRSKSRGD